MTFDSWANPEVIVAICVGIATIFGAIGTAIKKYNGKPWKEIIANLFTKELKEVKKTIEEVAKNVKEVKESTTKKKN